MKKIIVVEPTSTGVCYIHDIKEAGYSPVSLEIYTDEQERENQRWLHDHYYEKLEIEKPETIMAKENYEDTLALVKEQNPSFIVPGSDEGVILATRLATDLGLPCNNLENIVYLKNKYNQQIRLKEAGIRYIHSELVSSAEEAVRFFKDNNLSKMVIKPVSGGATVGVFIVDNEKAIISAVEKNIEMTERKDEKVLVQEFIEGKEFIMDSLFVEGKHYNTFCFDYNKIMVKGAAYVYDNGVIHNMAENKQLEEYADQVCDALGLTYGAVHNEYMVDDKGPVLIEANLRVCGAMMKWTFQNKVFGFHETCLSLESYVNPEKCVKSVEVLPAIPCFGALKVIIIPKRIHVKKVLFNDVMKKLKSCMYYLDRGAGMYYEKTIDLSTCGGFFYLAGSENDVKEDLAYLRDLEINGLHELFEF